MGICYGQMTMAEQLGGGVESGHHREFGRAEVEVLEASPLTEGVWRSGEKHTVWMSHGDRITRLPAGFKRIGVSANAPFALIADEARKYYGLMFHPEVVHTPDGARLISNFVHKVAGLKSDWTMAAFRAEAREAIRAQVGKGRVICGLSGGVDSSVAAVLIHEAIGDQLTCVFVDHGLMRGGEGDEVVAAVPRPFQYPARPRPGAGDLPRRARRRLRPGDQAQDDRPPVHRNLRGGSQEDRRRRPRPGGVSGARHALSRT